jgi:hypothetical protein
VITRDQANYYLKRIRVWLREANHIIQFKQAIKYKNHSGEYDPTISVIYKDGKLIFSNELNVVRLNPCSDIMATLIHEALHGIYSDYSEKKVLNLEKAITVRMSDTQFKNLLKLLAEKI